MIAHNVLFDFTCIFCLFFLLASCQPIDFVLSLWEYSFCLPTFWCSKFAIYTKHFWISFIFWKVSSFSSLVFFFLFWSCSILRRNTQSAFRYQVRRSTLVLCNYPKAWMTTLGLFGMYYCNKVFHWCFAIMYSVYRCNKHSQAS